MSRNDKMVLIDLNFDDNLDSIENEDYQATTTTVITTATTVSVDSYDFERSKPRLVKKSGELNINANKVPKRRRRLLSDFFNTILGKRKLSFH